MAGSGTGGRPYRRIATEEAWISAELLALYQKMLNEGSALDPGFDSLWRHYGLGTSERCIAVRERMLDIGERRIADMNAAGIDMQLLLLTTPGVQLLQAETAIALAAASNDQVSKAVERHPDRFAALAAVAPQAPQAAAKELERAVRGLKLKGAVINSHTRGEYLDDQKFWPIFEAAEALDVPIYIHPNTPPPDMIGPLLARGLDGAIYGFAVECGMHLLAIIATGVFDRFPKLQMVFGHLGEGLPFWQFRLDFMHRAQVSTQRYECLKPLKRKISDYMRENVYYTTSGMAWEPAIMFTRSVVGADRVLYAMDYPYQYVPEEVAAMERMPLSAPEKKHFFRAMRSQSLSSKAWLGRRVMLWAATVILVVSFFLAAPARSLTGGKNVGPDDIGAKASVALYYRGKPFCGGVVFADRYVLTAAHCFTDGRGNIVKSAERLEVRYWSSGQSKRDARRVEQLAVHENLRRQERLSYPSARPGDFINFPVNHEDIAILKINRPHPDGAVGTFLPPIDNEYTAPDGIGKSIWFYVYGAAVNGSYGKLQRALIGRYGPLERVIPDKPPELLHAVRQMTIITAAFNKDVSECHGDSGSGVFLAKSDGVEYDQNPDKLPETIELRDGLPILVGLVSQYPVSRLSSKSAPCGRDIGADAYEATRVDYYHDWIISKTKQIH